MSARVSWALTIGLALAGCSGGGDSDDPVPTPWPEHPADAVLSLAHAQVLGTHNSYHLRTDGVNVSAWDYEHLPLDRQMTEQGVRQFELDLNWVDGGWAVYHVPVIDEQTTCRAFADCLAALRAGSEALGPHLPVVVLLEVKDEWSDGDGPARAQALNDAVETGLGDRHLVRPADVQGASATLRDAMAGGWPVLAGQRGRFVMVVHENGPWAAEVRGSALSALFTDAYGDLTADWAAVHSINNPNDPRIPEVVAAGHLVRTRSDSDTAEALANDTSTRDAALASGATFVSTDFPAPHPDTGYVVRIPDGTPARCNPLGTPDVCSSEALEDPALLGP